MPMGTIVRETASRIGELQQRLAAEWKSPSASNVTEQPVILEENQPLQFSSAHKPLRLYVIWEEWNDLTQLDRSEIIMEAFEKTHDLPDILRVTLAMGLTSAEAKRMGLNYKIEKETPAV